MIHAFTSFTYSYLNRARVLARTVRQQHPEWMIWAVITDKPPAGFTLDLSQEDFDAVLTVDDLFGAETAPWLFGHDIVEACTAAKGKAATMLLDRPDCTKLVYFDPDIALFNRMDDLIGWLDDASIILTPHQTDPEPRSDKRAIVDNEVGSLNYGTFNLGFIALANDDEGRRFAAWWDDRLRDWCHDRQEIGVFVDQKWCNLAPCFFDRVKILRDPGFNVASWNLSQRRMAFDPDGLALINGQPLRFYHFTKLGAVGDTMTQRYARDNTEIYELWWWYRQQVTDATSPDIPQGWWHYGQFDDGRAIPKAARELYRSRADLRSTYPAPFGTGAGSFQEWLRKNTDLLDLPQT